LQVSFLPSVLLLKEKNKRWPMDIKQMKKALANRESVLSFTFAFSTEKCRNDTSYLEQLF
jgi:hypothetical protein